jgi:hypothetical protein
MVDHQLKPSRRLYYVFRFIRLNVVSGAGERPPELTALNLEINNSTLRMHPE